MKNSMKVVIYDRNPGKGFAQWALMMTWALGSRLQKLFGIADEVYGASSWQDAKDWLLNLDTYKIESLQYWGHGSPGTTWLAGVPMPRTFFLTVKYLLDTNSLIWFRTCSTFQGRAGIELSRHLADTLECTIAGHTRIIGFLQGGLHTRKPFEPASWQENEKDLPSKFLPQWLVWGKNTIFCFQNKVPKNW